MGTLRYKRPSVRRELSDFGDRLPKAEHGNPRPTFRAGISENWTSLHGERRAYYSTVGTDTVFWDYWDEDYDPHIFDAFVAPSGPDEGKLGAVDLRVPGIYAIRATIDWNRPFGQPPLTGAFNTWIGSNYDDGGVVQTYVDLASQFIGVWTLDQFRIVWPFFTGAESTVEITAMHDNAAQDPLYIPGGNSGYWAIPPMLTIVYLGGLDSDPEFSDGYV